MKRLAALLAALALACGPDSTRRIRPQLVPPESSFDFGAVAVLNEKKLGIPLLNVGRARLPIVSAALAPGSDSAFRVVEAPQELQSGETLEVQVLFVPLKEQDYQATLVVESEDPELPHLEVQLRGQGSTRAILELEPKELVFGRVAEGTAAVKTFTVRSKGTADLVLTELTFAEGSSSAFSFVGSTRTPAVVKTVAANGLPGQIQVTVKYAVAAGAPATASATIRLRSTDPDQQEVLLPVSGEVNRAPLPVIRPLGNGAPGLEVTLDGTGSTDPDGDLPLKYKWTLRRKPNGAQTSIGGPEMPSTSMRLDPILPGDYEVQLEVTDALGAKSLTPARATIVAAPAQKLLIEMFWDNAVTDLDLHVLRVPTAQVGRAPDDCFYANPKPDWGQSGDKTDDPEFLKDALTGYGPEVLGYLNPVDATYRIVVEFAHDHLSQTPASAVTVRVYEFGVVRGEFKKTLNQRGEVWGVADLVWPSGTLTPL